MKRIFTLLGVTLLAFTSHAQRVQTTLPRAPGPVKDVEFLDNRSGSESSTPVQRGNIFFTENFSNGFAGSNGFGPMTF